MTNRIFRKSIIPIWFIFIGLCIALFLIYPQYFTPQAIAEFMSRFSGLLLPGYFLISILRGFTLIPNTPFVLAGTIVFPHEPVLVLAISLTGIVFSSTMIFYYSDQLGFSDYLERKHPAKLIKIQDKLKASNGFLFVFFWSFLPILPTDAVSYAAGIIRMNFLKFILALTIGELIICSIYIFFYDQVLRLF